MSKDCCRADHEEIVDFFIDDAFLRSKKLRRHHERVARAQDALRRAADDDAWAKYLQVEEATNARAEAEVRIVFDRLLRVFARPAAGPSYRRCRMW
jgi:hypothetical protein